MALRALVYFTGNEFPAYGDYLNKITDKQAVKHEDTRSAQEIRNDIMKKLRGEKNDTI